MFKDTNVRVSGNLSTNVTSLGNMFLVCQNTIGVKALQCGQALGKGVAWEKGGSNGTSDHQNITLTNRVLTGSEKGGYGTGFVGLGKASFTCKSRKQHWVLQLDWVL